ncbi:MAG TPA: Re/Si-specific NAD(P)(+) transhydrogenase subunit alpha, partial [Polyangiaceae bacterium]|nr:Re/Si-specific NAD(P)(+) transhydrogenase subunit alpha [Polyangiaceae bacterium]
REQVQSMGADFLEVALKEEGSGVGGYAKEMSPEFIAAEMALFLAQAKEVDIIITTALIPGKPAPLLINEETVAAMKPGSVIVDLAAESGGNCAFTRPGEVVRQNGVTIIGYVDMPSRLAPLASQLYGSNLVHLLSDMGGAEKWRIDLDDQVVRGAIVLKEGELMWPPPRIEPSPAAAPKKAADKPVPTPSAGKAGGHGHGASTSDEPKSPIGLLVVAALVTALGAVAPREFLSHFTVFVLACFVGWQVVWNVTPALHTPLMSVTNAISGIIVVGGMLQLTSQPRPEVTWIGAAAVLLACINIAGGFLVTQRMLKMFRR